MIDQQQPEDLQTWLNTPHAWIEYEGGGKTHRINELISSPIKQIQANLLLHATPDHILVNGQPMAYFAGKHMGYPVTAGEQRHVLQHNIMGITLGHASPGYKVFAVNGDDRCLQTAFYVRFERITSGLY